MGILLLLFAIGIILIIKGGDIFVDSASAIARASGIPHFIIGATIVSIATTLPEVIVSTLAASQGKVDMALGNATGSVAVNTGLILGLGIVCTPALFRRKEFTLKSVLLIVTLSILLLLAADGSLGLRESLILLLLLALYIWENIREARRGTTIEVTAPEDRIPVARTAIMFILGTAGIIIGSQLLVNNGSEIAVRLGIPENVIALTMISLGTSLPELVTAVASIIKKEASLSVGNVIGANILNTTLVLPLCALACGGSLPVSAQTASLDIPICLLLSVILFIPALIKQRFMRWQGVLSMTIYLGYIIYVCL